MDNDFGDTLEAEMLAEYVSGGMTLVDAIHALGLAVRTVYRRKAEHPKFSAMLEDARKQGADAIANNVRKTVRGEEGYSSGDVKRDKLIAETDLKLLSKWFPKDYGDKLEIEQKSANVTVPVGDDPMAALRAYEQLLKGA